MIISASRRTDIPAFYSKWFINRIRAGWCQVPNPVNCNQISYVSLKPDDVDVIVFWSKDPSPMLAELDELDERGYRYYFLYTLNDYSKDFEPNIPCLEKRIETFQKLSEHIKPERVIWRYDPIIISSETPPSFHVNKFSKIACALGKLTVRTIISFADFYQKTERQLSFMENAGVSFQKDAVETSDAMELVKELAEIAHSHKMEMFTCAEERDFSSVCAPPGPCIDSELLNKLWSLHENSNKDPSQRHECLCVKSKDIGINDTCIHGCRYCYATKNFDLAKQRHSGHDPNSPVIWGKYRPLTENEKATRLTATLF